VSYSTLPIGTDTVTGTYSGDSTHAPLSGTAAETVSKDTTTTGLTSSPNPSGQAVAVTLTATVNSQSGVVPTGYVTFYSGSTDLGTGTLNGSGVATLNYTFNTTGSYNLTATYAGSTNMSNSTSPVDVQTVN
jgi:hypothetical protein